MWLDCRSDCHGGEVDAGIVADLGQGFQRPSTWQMGSSLGNTASTSVRLLISPLKRSSGLVLWILGPTPLRKLHVGQDIVLEVIHRSSDLLEALTN